MPLSAQDIPNPLPADEVSFQSLGNGLRLVVREDHSLPLVAMVVVVHAGSARRADTYGIAHYLEHLVFQGTAHYPGPLAPQNCPRTGRRRQRRRHLARYDSFPGVRPFRADARRW